MVSTAAFVPATYRSSANSAVCPMRVWPVFGFTYIDTMRLEEGEMKTFFWISILAVTLAAGTLSATGPDAKQLAEKGHSVFMAVLGGDDAKFAEALKYMEESRDLDPAYADNLYNLSRAY